MSHQPDEESRIDRDFAVTVPPEIRERADVEPGDCLRWRIDDDGTITIEVVSRRHGAFSDLEPVDVGEATDVAADHDALASED